MSQAEQPFAGLTPEVVLDAAAAAGLSADGRLFALNSYENRVYQLGHAEGQAVLKFYRAGRWSDAQILEEHEFTAELAHAELPVAAPLQVEDSTLVHFRGFRFAVFPWLRGRAPELDQPQARTLLGRAIARLHAIGARHAFAVRPRIDTARMGWEARAQVLDGELLPASLAPRYAEVAEVLLGRIDRACDEAPPWHETRLHGDCHLGNLLWNEQGPVFVDLDDCVNGPRIQDLWMLLSGPPAQQQAQWAEILEGYLQFGEIDYGELLLIEPLRGLRMLHHAAWVTRRWNDPAFPRAFPWFGEARFWEEHLNNLLEQVAMIDDPPLLQV